MNRPDRGAAPGLLVVSNGHGEDAIAPDGVATPGLLVVSNGHGEDAIGAALVRRLRHALPDLEIQALPLVGTGTAYEPELLVGPRRALPAGGLTLHHPRLLLQDVRAGIVGLTLR